MHEDIGAVHRFERPERSEGVYTRRMLEGNGGDGHENLINVNF